MDQFELDSVKQRLLGDHDDDLEASSDSDSAPEPNAQWRLMARASAKAKRLVGEYNQSTTMNG